MINIKDLEELFDKIDNFAQHHMKEIFELNGEKYILKEEESKWLSKRIR